MISITRNFEPQVRFIVDSIIAIIIIVAATVQEMNARPNNQLIIFFFIRYYLHTLPRIDTSYSFQLMMLFSQYLLYNTTENRRRLNRRFPQTMSKQS
jgi:hypothetical protein